MTRLTVIGFLCVCMTFGMAHATVSTTSSETIQSLPGGGGGDDKKEKGGKKGKGDEEEEDGQKRAKVQFSPQKAAKLSAKTARKNLRWKEQEIATRAKTRNFFHRTFNTKFGRPTNFRSKYTRNRWRKGRI